PDDRTAGRPDADSSRPAADDPGASAPAGAKPPARPRRRDTVTVQPVPEPQACVVPAAQDLQRERAWLRQTMSQQYDAAVSSMMRVLSEVPGLRGHAGTSAAEAVTDLVAIRLYLTGQARGLDDAVRTAQPGPHVPFARCVASGLRKLPS